MKNNSAFLLVFLVVCLSFAARASDYSAMTPLEDSAKLINAARVEINVGDDDTACNAYVYRSLNRAGFRIGYFVANGLDQAMKRALPLWKSQAFSAYESGAHAKLRAFLNSFPDRSAFVAQWKRSDESGHVAIIEKYSENKFVIYQAQYGPANPHKKAAPVASLLYGENDWGDRSRLRLFHP